MSVENVTSFIVTDRMRNQIKLIDGGHGLALHATASPNNFGEVDRSSKPVVVQLSFQDAKALGQKLIAYAESGNIDGR